MRKYLGEERGGKFEPIELIDNRTIYKEMRQTKLTSRGLFDVGISSHTQSAARECHTRDASNVEHQSRECVQGGKLAHLAHAR
jgi:hypothetical protein